MQERKPTRFAHTAGYTNVCFSEDGEYIITCGNEGDVRIWKGLDDDNPTEKCVGEKALAVIQKNDKLYAASDLTVQILSFPEGEIELVLTRFKDTVTSLSVSPDGAYIAAGSADTEIHLIETATSSVKYFSGHKGPILCVAIDPRMEYIASSSCDGTVRVWCILDQHVEKEWTDVTDWSTSIEKRTTLCGIFFEPVTGRRLAIAYKDEIKLYQRSTWNEISSLKKINSTTKDYSVISWSKCGRYLASSSYNGEITVWDALINTFVSSSCPKEKHLVSGLSWNPDSSKAQLAFVDYDGQFGIIENCYRQILLGNKRAATTEQKEDKQETNDDDIGEQENYDNVEAENESDDPDAISIEQIKADCSKTYDVLSTNLCNEVDDDDSCDDAHERSEKLNMPTFEVAAPFQPTSMPTDLERRFMVFNDVGYVKQTNTDDENTIDVDFHNASIHHSFRIDNILGHHIAALSADALVLACEEKGDSSSKLVCMRFGAWVDNKEWNIDFPITENAVLVAVAEKFVAVITDFNFLRIFTINGLQREILTVTGTPLTMNASRNLLVVVYHGCADPTGKQNVYFSVYRIDKTVTAVIRGESVPLTRDAELQWVGFSDNLNVCSKDSNGVVQIYTKNNWRPISLIDEELETKSNHYSVVGVDENTMNIRCILCKGSYYPLLIPHPFIVEKKWSLPVCEQYVERATFEQTLLAEKLALQCGSSATNLQDGLRIGLKLFALCCRSNMDMKALDVLELMNNTKLAEVSHKYCAQIGKLNLADKVADCISAMKNAEQEVHDDTSNNLLITDKESSIDSSETQCSTSTISTIHSRESTARNESGDQAPSLYPGTMLLTGQQIHKSLSEINKKLNKRKLNPFKLSQPKDGDTNGTDNSLSKWTDETDSQITDTPSIKNGGASSIDCALTEDSKELPSKKRKSTVNNETDQEWKKKATSKLKAFVFQKKDTDNS